MIRITVVSIAVAGLLAGCSADQPQPQPSLSLPPGLKEGLLKTADPDPKNQATAIEEYDRRSGEIMNSCMAADGFSYVPFRPAPTIRELTGLADEAFTKQYGLGISTMIDFHRPDVAQQDPNEAIRAAMSQQQREAFDRTRSKCDIEVLRQLGISPRGGAISMPGELVQGMAQVSAQSQADPRVVAAQRGYESCMASRGFTLAAGEQIGQGIQERAQPFQQKFVAGRQNLARQGHDPVTVKLADVLSVSEMAELSKVQQFELAISWAHWECGKEFRDTSATVFREHLGKYLDGEGS